MVENYRGARSRRKVQRNTRKASLKSARIEARQTRYGVCSRQRERTGAQLVESAGAAQAARIGAIGIVVECHRGARQRREFSWNAREVSNKSALIEIRLARDGVRTRKRQRARAAFCEISGTRQIPLVIAVARLSEDHTPEGFDRDIARKAARIPAKGAIADGRRTFIGVRARKLDLTRAGLLHRTVAADDVRIRAVGILIEGHHCAAVDPDVSLKARRVSAQGSRANQGAPGVGVFPAKRELRSALFDEATRIVDLRIGDYIVELLIGADVERQRRATSDLERRTAEFDISNRRRIGVVAQVENSRRSITIDREIHRGVAIDRYAFLDDLG